MPPAAEPRLKVASVGPMCPVWPRAVSTKPTRLMYEMVPSDRSTLATFSLGSAAGGILGGLLSDRLGRIAVLRSSVLAGIPLFVALVYSAPGSWWYYPLTALVGVVVNANTPVAIVLAQEYAPDHVATASALMMGFAWGTSGVLFTLVGALADLTSPRAAMVAAILLLVPALWLTVRLPEPEPHAVA